MPRDGQVYPEVIRCHVMAKFNRRFIRCHVMARFTRRFIRCHVMAGCNHEFISCHGVVRSGLPTVYDGYMDGTLLISEYGITILILMVMVHVMVTSLHADYTYLMIGLCCVQFRL